MDPWIEFENEKSIWPKVAQKGVHVAINAHQDGHYREQRGDANDHAQHGEKGAHFVFTQRRERHLRVFSQLHVHRDFHCRYTSCRSASMGCNPAAFLAGYTPKKIPTAAEMTSASNTAAMGTFIGTEVVALVSTAMAYARITPIAPPTADITAASIRNCNRISLRCAPMALRIPISRVRSVTVASITFMITTPPITRNTETTPTIAVAITPVKLFHSCMSVAESRIPKLSGSLGLRWRRPRMMARASSCVRSIQSGPVAWMFTQIVSFVPYILKYV